MKSLCDCVKIEFNPSICHGISHLSQMHTISKWSNITPYAEPVAAQLMRPTWKALSQVPEPAYKLMVQLAPSAWSATMAHVALTGARHGEVPGPSSTPQPRSCPLHCKGCSATAGTKRSYVFPTHLDASVGARQQVPAMSMASPLALYILRVGALVVWLMICSSKMNNFC